MLLLKKKFNADGRLDIPPSIFGEYYIKGFLEGYEEGYIEGLKIGYKERIRKRVQRYIKKDPSATDQSVAELFDVSLDLVQKARQYDEQQSII